MSATETVNIMPGAPTGPTLEESYAALKAEGLVSDDADGAVFPDSQVAQGGADGEQEEAAAERPSWLPEKFKTVEEYTAYVAELEGKVNGGDKDGAGDDDAGSEPTPEERKAAEEATARAGLDLNDVSKEWADNGGLKDETYEKLAKAGYPREMVDIYIEGLTARNAPIATEAFNVAGGEEQYGAMIDWAIENLSQAEQEAFDEAVNSNNKSKALLAVRGLHASYSAAQAKVRSNEPTNPLNPRGSAAVTGYAHLDDYLSDLNDPRYDKSESFRSQVAAKLAQSPNL